MIAWLQNWLDARRQDRLHSIEMNERFAALLAVKTGEPVHLTYGSGLTPVDCRHRIDSIVSTPQGTHCTDCGQQFH